METTNDGPGRRLARRRRLPSPTSLLRLVLFVVAGLMAVPGCADAQIAPFTYELRAGSSIPVGPFADPDEHWAGPVDAGYSFGMGFAYTFEWYLAGYAGFSQHRFRCRAEACGRATDLTGTGFDLGIRWILGSGSVIPLLRTGLVTYRVEGRTPGSGGGPEGGRVVSHRTLGLEGGASLSIRISRRIVLTPGIRYLHMTADFGATGDLPTRAVIADLGVMLGF